MTALYNELEAIHLMEKHNLKGYWVTEYEYIITNECGDMWEINPNDWYIVEDMYTAIIAALNSGREEPPIEFKPVDRPELNLDDDKCKYTPNGTFIEFKATQEIEKAGITFNHVEEFGWIAVAKDGKVYEASEHEWEDHERFTDMWQLMHDRLAEGMGFDTMPQFGHITDSELIEHLYNVLVVNA